MSRQPEHLRTGVHYAAADFGAPAQWMEYTLDHHRLGPVPGKHFTRATLGMTGSELSLGAAAPGRAMPFKHSHKRNEELYIFIEGEGEMQVDGEKFPVRAGSIVRVAPAGVRAWRNTGAGELRYLVLQCDAGSLKQATGDDGVVSDLPVTW